MSATSLFDVLKPILWLALAAFVTGFLSYLALGGAHASAKAPPDHARVSAPASDDWNLPKQI